MTKPPPTYEQIRKAFKYDQETGALTWLRPSQNVALIEKPAGSVAATGYIVINFSRKFGPLLAHRIAHIWMTGDWPRGQIDHINGCRTDNRWANLRDVSSTENCHNTHKPSKNNQLGLRGVSACGSKYRSRIMAFGKTHDLGVFDLAEDARLAYLSAKTRLHIGAQP